jgi:hypothetical protein
MGIKRSLIGFVTMVVAVVAVAIGLSAQTPDIYFDMSHSTGVAPLIALNSATTSYTSPDIYFDM